MAYSISADLWRKACNLYFKSLAQDEVIGRRKLAELLKIKSDLASKILFAIKNRNLFTIDIRQHEIKRKTTELIISDLHIPYEDKSAIAAIYDYLTEQKIVPNIITILGDLMDFYQISTFKKIPTNKNMKQELAEAKEFLIDLRNRFPDTKIYYYQGNHEERLERYIVKNAKEIYELVDNLIEEKLDLNSLNIEYVVAPFKIGKLWHLHGHESPTRSNPEYVTNVMWKYIHDNFIIGHFHRNQEKVYKNIEGKQFWGGVVGHLASTLDYAILNNWNQGFAIIDYDDKGNFKPQLIPINNGVIL